MTLGYCKLIPGYSNYESVLLQSWYDYELFQLIWRLAASNLIWIWALQIRWILGTNLGCFKLGMILSSSILDVNLCCLKLDMDISCFKLDINLNCFILYSCLKFDMNLGFFKLGMTLSSPNLIVILTATNFVWIWALLTWYEYDLTW